MLRFSPVSLVKHHVLHIVQLQVHVLDDVHQTTKCADDSAGKKHRRQDCTLWFGWGESSTHESCVTKHSHVRVFMKSSKLIIHTGKEQRHLYSFWSQDFKDKQTVTHLSPPRIKAVFSPVNFPNYNTRQRQH